MTLIEPAWVTFWNKWKTYLVMGGLAVLLVGVALFLWSWGSDYLLKRDIDRKKENVNIALTEANQVAANVASEKETAKKIAANVNVAVQDYLGAINATDATRNHVNAAVEQMQKAANTNVGNVNAEQVEEAMRGL